MRWLRVCFMTLTFVVVTSWWSHGNMWLLYAKIYPFMFCFSVVELPDISPHTESVSVRWNEASKARERIPPRTYDTEPSVRQFVRPSVRAKISPFILSYGPSNRLLYSSASFRFRCPSDRKFTVSMYIHLLRRTDTNSVREIFPVSISESFERTDMDSVRGLMSSSQSLPKMKKKKIIGDDFINVSRST